MLGLLFLQMHATDWLNTVMVIVSTVTNGGLLWLVASGLLLCTKKYRGAAVAIWAALLVCVLAGNLLLKNVVARPRPCDVIPEMPLLIPQPQSFSFPSGHTMSSFAAATVLLFASWKWGIAAYAMAGVVGFSRVYLFVHYPTDVLAGVALGIAVAGWSSGSLPKRAGSPLFPSAGNPSIAEGRIP